MTIDSKPQLQRIAADADVELICKALHEEGAFILKGILPADVVERFSRELDVQLAATPAKGAKLLADKYPRYFDYITNIPGTCETFRHDILNNPILHGICEAYFKQTGDYWLSAAFLRSVYPGTPAQKFHRDNAIHPLTQYLPLSAPPISISFLFPMTEFTETNGATEVILGSHRWAELGTPSRDQTVAAAMSPGDSLVLRQAVVHSGGSNPTVTDKPRRAVTTIFNSCQLTPFETYRTMPREMVESMTPLAQKMIGWRSMDATPPNLAGLNMSNDRQLEDVLQLKSNQ